MQFDLEMLLHKAGSRQLRGFHLQYRISSAINCSVEVSVQELLPCITTG
jgi:hypothetical protein